MRKTLRRNTIAVAAVAAVGAVAFASPGMAKGLFDASNAHKVDGYHAKDLTKTQYFANDVDTDNFNTCAYTTLLSRNFKTTHKGVISVVANVNAERDFDNAAAGLLSARIVVDGTVASAPSTMELTGFIDHTTTAIGAVKKPKGNHTVDVQVRECGTGLAFVTSESMIVSYTPFGGAHVPPTLKVKAGGQQR